MEHHEGWNSLEMNQRLRAIQPDIIINDRCHLPEDFGTPEEHLTAEAKRDWESCMTFNGISWGYVDSAQAVPYSYNAQRIIKMLGTVAADGGNLLLNIGPTPDGSVPKEAVEPLNTVGRWLLKNGECVYGKLDRSKYRFCNGVSSVSVKGNTVYLWNMIWPDDGEVVVGGFGSKLKSVRLVADDIPVEFREEDWRIVLTGLPASARDPITGITVLALEFEEELKYIPFRKYPSLNNGREYKTDCNVK
jgi:alpha-L-fucosidase